MACSVAAQREEPVQNLALTDILTGRRILLNTSEQYTSHETPNHDSLCDEYVQI